MSDRKRPRRDSTVSEPNVRPRNSSATFSCSSVYPLTHARPQNTPSHTVTTAASARCRHRRQHEQRRRRGDSNDDTNTSSRSTNFATWFEPAMPIAIPTPNATTTIAPARRSSAPSVVVTKIGPSASTAPTAANAITMPGGHRATRASPRDRNRTPSTHVAPDPATGRTRSNAARVGASERHAAHHRTPRTRTCRVEAAARATPGVAKHGTAAADRGRARAKTRRHRAGACRTCSPGRSSSRWRAAAAAPGSAATRRAPASTAARSTRSRTTAGRSARAAPTNAIGA